MTELYSRWKAAKDHFFAADLDTNSLPPRCGTRSAYFRSALALFI